MLNIIKYNHNLTNLNLYGHSFLINMVVDNCFTKKVSQSDVVLISTIQVQEPVRQL